MLLHHRLFTISLYLWSTLGSALQLSDTMPNCSTSRLLLQSLQNWYVGVSHLCLSQLLFASASAITCTLSLICDCAPAGQQDCSHSPPMLFLQVACNALAHSLALVQPTVTYLLNLYPLSCSLLAILLQASVSRYVH